MILKMTQTWVGKLTSLNNHTSQGNLYTQCNPYQNTYGIFNRTKTNNFKISVEIQKTPHIQNNLKK